MGKRGPKPTPTSVLKARGSWRAKTRTDEPKPPTATPSCPKGLGPHARSVWKWLSEQLAAMQLLSTAEAKTMERYCVISELHHLTLREIKKHGQMVTLHDSNGNVVQAMKNPLLGERARLSAELLRIEQQFGLTPSARVGLKVNAPSPANAGGKEEDDDQSYFRPHIVG